MPFVEKLSGEPLKVFPMGLVVGTKERIAKALGFLAAFSLAFFALGFAFGHGYWMFAVWFAAAASPGFSCAAPRMRLCRQSGMTTIETWMIAGFWPATLSQSHAWGFSYSLLCCERTKRMCDCPFGWRPA